MGEAHDSNGGEWSPQHELTYSWHALYVMAERLILPEWVQRTVADPALRTSDPTDSTVERFYRGIPEREHRVLRVAVNTPSCAMAGSERIL